MFGHESREGLTTSSFTRDVLKTLESEDDLVAVVASTHTISNANNEPLTANDEPLTANDEPSHAPANNLPVPVPLSTNTANKASAHDNPSLTEHKNQIRKRRAAAFEAQVEQAERRVKRSKVVLKSCEIDDNVVVPIPMID